MSIVEIIDSITKPNTETVDLSKVLFIQLQNIGQNDYETSMIRT